MNKTILKILSETSEIPEETILHRSKTGGNISVSMAFEAIEVAMKQAWDARTANLLEEDDPITFEEWLYPLDIKG